MTFGKFLSDRLGRILLQLICFAAAALFLAASGTQTGIIAILFLVLLPVFLTVHITDYLRLCSRMTELENILENLDKKYLFAECVPAADRLYERCLFDLMRRAGRAMIGAVSDAEAAQREYREYVESWVHEIKAPLTAARLICRQLDDNSRRKLDFELAQIEAHIERALFYARAESPERDCVIRQTGLSEIVSQAVENHRSLLIQSGIRIETRELDRQVFTDKKWAVFILGQLLQNSARYRSGDPVITIAAESYGKQIRLTVRDNGIGIPAHELPRVFDRGFTGTNGRTRGGATGMGLYLCKRLSTFLDLDISLTSQEGEGTCVALLFPVRENLTKT